MNLRLSDVTKTFETRGHQVDVLRGPIQTSYPEIANKMTPASTFT